MASFKKILFPIVILAVGGVATAVVIKTKKTPEVVIPEDLGALVEVVPAKSETSEVRVHAFGTVVAAQEITLMPELSSRIVWKNPKLELGGRIKKGEQLIRLDASDYQLAVAQQEAQIDQAQVNLRLEEGRQDIAAHEWKVIGEASDASANNDLALRKPQLRSVEAGLKAAKNARDQAALRLSKTAIVAPFNAIVQAARGDVGQLVGPSSQIATLVGTDKLWVKVTIPLEQIARIQFPGSAPDAVGAKAKITQRIGKNSIIREGHVLRLLPDLEQVGRLARVLVEIENPFDAVDGADKAHEKLPLLVGSYVSVEIEAEGMEKVFAIPRSAIRDGDKVNIAIANSTLSIRQLDIAWREDDIVYATAGLKDGDRVIMTKLSGAVEGLKLRVAGSPVTASPATASSATGETAKAAPKAVEAVNQEAQADTKKGG